MEEWKDGRMEGWKSGRMEGWLPIEFPSRRNLGIVLVLVLVLDQQALAHPNELEFAVRRSRFRVWDSGFGGSGFRASELMVH
jgi:hypothetical protein